MFSNKYVNNSQFINSSLVYFLIVLNMNIVGTAIDSWTKSFYISINFKILLDWVKGWISKNNLQVYISLLFLQPSRNLCEHKPKQFWLVVFLNDK